LMGILELFEKIHNYRAVVDGVEKSGLVWNDVKPEHLFWDPQQHRFTVIDWGNGQFLEADGATKDRRYSRLDDYSQFVQELGKFLSSTSPELHARLEWPGNLILPEAYTEAVKALKERISGLLLEEQQGLRDARQAEEILTFSSAPAIEQLSELEAVQAKIVGYGKPAGRVPPALPEDQPIPGSQPGEMAAVGAVVRGRRATDSRLPPGLPARVGRRAQR
jgi:hypothetical protein